MGLVIDGTTISTSANVYVDGIAVNNVYIDGTLVWTKNASGKSWKIAWSGSLILPPYVNSDPYYGGYEEGYVEQVYSNITADISGKEIQVDAKFYYDVYDENLEYGYSEELDSLSLNTSSTSSNLPWSPSGTYMSSQLYHLDIGSGVYQGAWTGWMYLWGSYMFEWFEVTALYYYG